MCFYVRRFVVMCDNGLLCVKIFLLCVSMCLYVSGCVAMGDDAFLYVKMCCYV
jgi:hypothetical protein